jgi:hypothetical protein
MPKKKTYDLPQFKEPQEWQEQINEVKQEMVGLETAEVARTFAMWRKEKKELEEKIKEINTEMEACSQLLVEHLQGQDVQKITLSTGETVYLQSDPYPSVQDKEQLRMWVVQTGMEEILSVHYQTLVGLVKERLNNGEEPPPGVEVFLKTKARCRAN